MYASLKFSTNKPCALFCKSFVEKITFMFSTISHNFKTNLALLHTEMQG